jgi:hypothetical protein
MALAQVLIGVVDMAAEQEQILISPDSELGIALKRAYDRNEPIAVRIGDESYEIDVLETRVKAEPSASSEPDSILSIIGIATTAEPSDIARYKDEYLADAYDYRKR